MEIYPKILINIYFYPIMESINLHLKFFLIKVVYKNLFASWIYNPVFMNSGIFV